MICLNGLLNDTHEAVLLKMAHPDINNIQE